MAYLRTDRFGSTLGGLGCGPGCHCGSCRAAQSGLGERYIEDDDRDEEPDPDPRADSKDRDATPARDSEPAPGVHRKLARGRHRPIARRLRTPDTAKGSSQSAHLSGTGPAPYFLRFGEAPPHTRWGARRAVSPAPPQLRFSNLDRFEWNQSRLTPRLRDLVAHLANQVRLSWTQRLDPRVPPIAYVRLVGHTDNSGSEKYNAQLGDRRAAEVKAELERILAPDILNKRIRIAILVEPSPGMTKPVADNRTSTGMALNRRVEVFIERPVLPPPPPPPPPCLRPPCPWSPPQPIPSEVEILQQQIQRALKTKIPPHSTGKSLKAYVDDRMADLGVSRAVRDRVWDAVMKQDGGLASDLLTAAGVKGPLNQAVVSAASAVLQTPVR